MPVSLTPCDGDELSLVTSRSGERRSSAVMKGSARSGVIRLTAPPGISAPPLLRQFHGPIGAISDAWSVENSVS